MPRGAGEQTAALVEDSVSSMLFPVGSSMRRLCSELVHDLSGPATPNAAARGDGLEGAAITNARREQEQRETGVRRPKAPADWQDHATRELPAEGLRDGAQDIGSSCRGLVARGPGAAQGAPSLDSMTENLSPEGEDVKRPNSEREDEAIPDMAEVTPTAQATLLVQKA